MGNKEVIDYVMNSPGNTNKAVLKGLLGDIAGDGSGGDVLTVTVDEGVADKTWQEIYDAMPNVVMFTPVNPDFQYSSNTKELVVNISVLTNNGVPYEYDITTYQNGYSCVAPDDYPVRQ